MNSIHVTSTASEELLDVTAAVAENVKASGVKTGVCHIHCPHTTAAVTVNEAADPAVAEDIVKSLADIVRDVGFEHAECNSAAHVKSSLLGCTALIPIEEGTLKLGTWQGIFLCEFDGPRTRTLWIRIHPSAAIYYS